MHLEAASQRISLGLVELLAELGDGEHGFGGTPVASGEMALEAYLQQCMEMAAGNVRPGMVPQTVFWALNDAGEATGMVRMRHMLNERLRERGGHIGYYLRRAQRGRGYGKEMLRLALLELRKLGEPQALLTVDLDNIGSIKVIEANGGIYKSSGQNEDGTLFGRYWIPLGEEHP